MPPHHSPQAVTLARAARVERTPITATDLALIATIRRYGKIAASELLALAPGHPSHKKERLACLVKRTLVSRFRVPTTKSPLATEYNYYLTNPDALFYLSNAGYTITEDDGRTIKNNRDKKYDIATRPGQLQFLIHELNISSTRFMLEAGSRSAAVQLGQFTRNKEALTQRVTTPKLKKKHNTETGKAYRYVDTTEEEIVPWIPDALFTLHFSADREQHYFYEEDQGTMHYPEMLQKFRAYYHAIVLQKLHQPLYDIGRVRAVLIKTTTIQRAIKLAALAGRACVSKHPSNLFWFTATEPFTKPHTFIIPSGAGEYRYTKPAYQFRPQAIYDRIWFSPKHRPGDRLHSLLDP